MSNIIKFGLELPQIGTSGNWGSTVNQNFIKISNEIQKIYQTINSAQSLIGANVPYINVNKQLRYFVKVYHQAKNVPPSSDKISAPEGISLDKINCILKFYGEVQNDSGTFLQQTETYYYHTDNDEALKWNPILPMYSASYVMGVYAFDEEGNTQDMLEENIEQTSTIMPSWDKSDILVVVPEFGSVYGDNYTASFKKYLPIGDYYKPELATDPYQLKFIKKDFVSWYQEQAALAYTLPAIGLGVFNNFTLTKVAENEFTAAVNQTVIEAPKIEDDVWKLTVTPARPNNADEASQIAPKFNWYIKSGSQFQPVFIAYNYSYAESGDKSSIIYAIQVDVSNLEQGEELYGEMYFNFRDDFVPYPIQGGSAE